MKSRISNKPTCIIVDDEPIARRITEKYLEEYPSLELLDSFNSATAALEFLNQNHVHVMFLDINMPKLTGIEMIRSIQTKPLTIITTAYPNYAIESFELDVVDYLLKPFSFERFVAASNRCIDRLNVITNNRHKEEENYIIVKQDKKFHKILISEIIYIESIGDYVKFHLPGKIVIGNQTMKSLEEYLSSTKFMRVHKSFIVSIDHITGMYGSIIEVDKKEIPVGESYRSKVKQFIDERLV